MVRSLTAASLLALAAAAPGAAQSFGGAPAHGEVAFTPGDAPVRADVRAGGAISADRLDQACLGFVNAAPSLVLNLREAGPVHIAGANDEDTTLIVRGPEGNITCNDDGAGGVNPGVAFAEAPAGAYEIWLGTYDAGIGYPPGVIHVATDRFITDNPFAVQPDPDRPAESVLRLEAGFENDPRRLDVITGGEARLDALNPACRGYAGRAPDAEIEYQAGAYDLFFLLESDRDSTLAVRTPSGEVVCNDDRVGLNGGVQVPAPESGRYLVWAGSRPERGVTTPGVLSVSEIGYGGQDNRLDLAADARFGSQSLRWGFIPDPVVVEVQAGGAYSAALALSNAVVAEGVCVGHVTREPTFELDLEAGDPPLFISAQSETDTTLAVNAPDGAWYCDDDTNEADPSLAFSDPQSGVYDIYVGTFFPGEPAPARLLISELQGGEGPSSDGQLDIALPALAGDHALQTGFRPDPYTIEVEAGGPIDASGGGAAEPGMVCTGLVTRAPTIQLDWSGEGGLLSLFVQSGRDTTLVVNMPDGSWMCDDDGGVGFDAALTLESAPSGIYDIYVGRFFGAEALPAVLNISERAAPRD